MKKKLMTLVLIVAIMSSIVSCQIYDQNTNGVIYTAIPVSGEKSRAALVDKIEEFKDSTSDLIGLAQGLDASYTGVGKKPDTGVAYNKANTEIQADILLLWDLKYPVKWDFSRK